MGWEVLSIKWVKAEVGVGRRLCSYQLLFYTYPRRHTPYGNQTDYRIFELNKRLQNWTEVSRGKRRVRDIWAPLWDIF